MESSMKIRVDLRDVHETLLLPLWGRAEEAKMKEPVLKDRRAEELVSRLDYDFSKFRSQLRQFQILALAIRAREFDSIIRDFIQQHPYATVVNIGAGLDTTFSRVNNGRIRWYDLDVPQVIHLRGELIVARVEFARAARDEGLEAEFFAASKITGYTRGAEDGGDTEQGIESVGVSGGVERRADLESERRFLAGLPSGMGANAEHVVARFEPGKDSAAGTAHRDPIGIMTIEANVELHGLGERGPRRDEVYDEGIVAVMELGQRAFPAVIGATGDRQTYLRDESPERRRRKNFDVGIVARQATARMHPDHAIVFEGEEVGEDVRRCGNAGRTPAVGRFFQHLEGAVGRNPKIA